MLGEPFGRTTCIRFGTSLVRGRFWLIKCKCGWSADYDTKKHAIEGLTRHIEDES